jgi:hypothetical protein
LDIIYLYKKKYMMNKITVLFPGGFKPLTGAHLALAERYAEDPQVEQVILLIGPTERDGITRQKTIEMFNLLNSNSKIKIQPTEFNSPITAAYEYLFALPQDATGQYAMAASTKGDDYVRAKLFVPNVDKYRTIGDKKGRTIPAGIDAIELNIDVEPLTYATGQPISASNVRLNLMKNDYNAFRKSYPNNDEAYVKNAWQILKGVQEASLFSKAWWTKSLHEDVEEVIEAIMNTSERGAHNKKIIKLRGYLDNNRDDSFVYDFDKFPKTVFGGVLTEGGAAGHMAHPYDDHGLTFNEMKEIVSRALEGRLDIEEAVTEKTDGQNIFVTWKNNEIGFARGVGTIINPMTTSEIIADFQRKQQKAIAEKGADAGVNYQRVVDAYQACAEDLTEAFGMIPADKLNQIFKNGKIFANMEIIYPATKNVISYDKAHLQFHNLAEYDDAGKIIETDLTGGSMIQGIIQNANAHMQKTFSFIPPQKIKLGRAYDFEDQQAAFFSEIDQLQNKFGLQPTDLVTEYHKAWWSDVIKSKAQTYAYDIPDNILESLVYRWAFNVKSTNITILKKGIDNPEFANWVAEFDKKDFKVYQKQNMEPFENIFLKLGAVVLKNAENFLAANPSATVQEIKRELAELTRELQAKGDVATIKKLEYELLRLQKLGGFEAIVPSEGVVFVYGGHTYKLTGAFAPINQILGVLKYTR